MTEERCSWCRSGVGPGDGWRAAEPAGERRAVFCRLEHVFPWWVKGPHWEAGEIRDAKLGESLTKCAHCGEPLPDKYVLLVSHRGDYRVPDAFCSVEHLAKWAKQGGRWAP